MTKMRIISVLVVAAVLVLVPSMAIAQSSASQPVDPPQQVAQLRQQFEGLTQKQIEDEDSSKRMNASQVLRAPGLWRFTS